MSEPTIVLTGGNGFLGARLTRALEQSGCVVWNVSRRAIGFRSVAADLLDLEAAHRAFTALPEFSILIHLAAIAHGQSTPRGETARSANGKMLKHVLSALRGRQPHFIFLSSVAVFGEDGRRGPICATDELRPATDYGAGKREDELQSLSTSLPDVDIVRLAPVFDDAHRQDVRKRVVFPGTNIRMRLVPPPRHSLCQGETIDRAIVALAQRGRAGRRLHVVADAEPYSQATLHAWFTGSTVTVRHSLIRPLWALLRLMPGRLGYRLRCLYWKLFESNVFIPTPAAGLPTVAS
jgi:nucleoside-diphosphate-sugar epimerase